MSNTIKPKKVLIASYCLHSEFKIPRGIDLEAEGVKYNVYGNKLYITLPDGTKIEVDATFGPEDSDFEEPNECAIEDDDQEDED